MSQLNCWTLCFRICVELCLSNSNLVCNIIYVETLLHKNWNVVISGPAFVWAMFALPILEAKWFLLGFYPRDCRYEPSEVRVKPHLPLRWWLAHLSRFCRAVLPQLQTYRGRAPVLLVQLPRTKSQPVNCRCGCYFAGYMSLPGLLPIFAMPKSRHAKKNLAIIWFMPRNWSL